MANAAVALMQEVGQAAIAVVPPNVPTQQLRAEIRAASAFTPKPLQLATANGRLTIAEKAVVYCDGA